MLHAQPALYSKATLGLGMLYSLPFCVDALKSIVESSTRTSQYALLVLATAVASARPTAAMAVASRVTNKTQNCNCADTSIRTMSGFVSRSTVPLRIMRRYDYYGGLRAGVSDLVGRDHAVAHALVQTYSTTSIEIHLAFVCKEQSGQFHQMSKC